MSKKMWQRIFKGKAHKQKVLLCNSNTHPIKLSSEGVCCDQRRHADGDDISAEDCAAEVLDGIGREHGANLKYQTSSMGAKNEPTNAGGTFTKVMHSFALKRNSAGSAAKNDVPGDISINCNQLNSIYHIYIHNFLYIHLKL